MAKVAQPGLVDVDAEPVREYVEYEAEGAVRIRFDCKRVGGHDKFFAPLTVEAGVEDNDSVLTPRIERQEDVAYLVEPIDR
jgi:hypothetical protein